MTPAPPQDPSSSSSPARESLFSRIILAPILFVSFIISLLIIDRRTSSSVFSSPRAEGSHTHLSTPSHGRARSHSPSPRQSTSEISKDGDGKGGGDASGNKPGGGGGEGEKGEYYHSHQRKLARRDMDDAFEMRKKVLVGMGGVAFLGVVAVGWFGWRVWRWAYD